MTEERINTIEIDWQGLFKPIEGLQTSPQGTRVMNGIVVKPEIIPIIFVPGIMGSRLRQSGNEGKAWDPDAPVFMGVKYGLQGTPNRRKQMLIGGQSHDGSYLAVDPDNDKVPDIGKDKGWGGVAWSFYGRILKALTAHEWPNLVHACFDLPVYAFGYNWTDSNFESGRQLAKAIEKIIDENGKEAQCRQVILVTHSMGGLVARSACKLHGAESNVLGVVHGTQPATGSPAAYQRMKHGFRHLDGSMWDWLCHPIKKVTERVLGNKGPAVTIVLANMPGGLELLPNQLYQTNDGQTQWLHYEGADGANLALPLSDPYEEIYSEKSAPYRLVNPRWLGEQLSSGNEYHQVVRGEWKSYKGNLKKAKKLHKKLLSYFHPETFQFYSTGIDTADQIRIYSHKMPGEHLFYLKDQEGKRFFEFRDSANHMIDAENDPFLRDPTALEGHPRREALAVIHAYAVAPPTGSGDGTVPDSSGKALIAKPSYYNKGPDGTVEIHSGDEKEAARMHDQIFSSRTAQHITLKAIENLCKTKIKNETGI
jgi:triacylglycerol esterase/lipase EstA (alpha/beta hydrolase family)